MIVTVLTAAYMLLVPKGRWDLTAWEKRQLRTTVLASVGAAVLLRFVVRCTARTRL